MASFFDPSFPPLVDLDTNQFFSDSPSLSSGPSTVPALLEASPFMLHGHDGQGPHSPGSQHSDESASMTSQEERVPSLRPVNTLKKDHLHNNSSTSLVSMSDMDTSEVDVELTNDTLNMHQAIPMQGVPQSVYMPTMSFDSLAAGTVKLEGGGITPFNAVARMQTEECNQDKALDGDDDPSDTRDSKKQRLARKAELARLSRKRKKMRMTVLEDQVRDLQQELEKERALRRMAESKAAEALNHSSALEQGSEGRLPAATTEHQSELKAMHARLRKRMADFMALKSPSSVQKQQFETQSALMVADIVRVCKTMLENPPQFGFLNHAVPLPLAFLEWVMSQSEAFYSDPIGLWVSLFEKEVGLSGEQMSHLLALKAAMRAAQQPSTLAVFMDYATVMKNHLATASKHMDQLVSIFSPAQLARFLAWVDSYGAVCIKISM